MTNDFPHDVFLSHSAKDKAVVRPLEMPLRGEDFELAELEAVMGLLPGATLR